MELKELLENINIWWEDKEAINHLVEPFERTELEKVNKDIQFHRITSIIGPRRTGKTTILFQCIKKLIDSGTEPKNILFISLDNSTLKLLSNNVLEDVFNIYFEHILFQKPAELEKKLYIFLDEVQKIEDWAEWIKNKYDFFKKIKFIISGSSALKILSRTRETLVGRVSTILLFPLTFNQFLKLNNVEAPLLFDENLNLELLRKEYGILKKDELKIKRLLNEYILVGGFIEWFKIKDIYKWHSYIQEDILDKLLLGDIIAEYDIRDKEGLKRIVQVLSKSKGNLFSMYSLAKEALAGKDVIETYISILKDGFIIYTLENYSQHIGVVLRKNKKINLIDIGLVNSIRRTHNFSKTEFGIILEMVVQQHIFYYSKINNFESYFYRDQEDREVDAVLVTNKNKIPIEVKSGDSISDKNISFFIDKFKSKFGIILTEKELSFEKNIFRIPYWFFLATTG